VGTRREASGRRLAEAAVADRAARSRRNRLRTPDRALAPATPRCHRSAEGAAGAACAVVWGTFDGRNASALGRGCARGGVQGDHGLVQHQNRGVQHRGEGHPCGIGYE
jgi:hypothetical protein